MPDKLFDKIIPIMIICIASLFFRGGIDTVFLVSLIVLLIYVYHDRRLCFDIGDVLLALGTFSYYIFTHQGIDDAIYYSLIYVLMYQVGKKISSSGGFAPEDKAAWMAIAIGVARMVMGFLHYSVRPAGATEEWIGWGQDTPTPRTGFEMYLIVMASLLGYFILMSFTARKKLRILAIIATILSLVCVYLAVSAEGRLALGCCLCGTAVVLGLFFIESKLYKKLIGKIFIVMLSGMILLLPIVYVFDLFGYKTMFDNSFMSGGNGIFTNVRFSLMLQQIKLLRYYPMGKCDVPLLEYNVRKTDYVHNFWLDIGRRGGIIPAMLYIGFSVTNIISMIKVWYKSRNINRYAIIAAFIGEMLYSSLEATIFGKVYWSSIILMGGLLRGMATDVCKTKKIRKAATQTISLEI